MHAEQGISDSVKMHVTSALLASRVPFVAFIPLSSFSFSPLRARFLRLLVFFNRRIPCSGSRLNDERLFHPPVAFSFFPSSPSTDCFSVNYIHYGYLPLHPLCRESKLKRSKDLYICAKYRVFLSTRKDARPIYLDISIRNGKHIRSRLSLYARVLFRIFISIT